MTSTRSSARSFAAFLPRVVAILALALAACGTRDVETVRDAARHATALAAGSACTDVAVHDKHTSRFPCTTCHPTGGAYGFTAPYTFPNGTTTAGGTLVRGTATTPTTCAVGCHQPGSPAHEVAWNTPGPLACTECHATTSLPPTHPPVAANATRADCSACHLDTGHMGGTVALVAHQPAWSDVTNAGFHAFSANAGLAGCQGCHGQDLAGGAVRRACGECHDVALPAGVASWKVNCVMCHGGTDSQTGAPPRATWGNAADAVRTGAHTRHVAGGAIAPPFGCAVCHATPSDALSTGHVDGGTAEVVFGGIASAGAPAWDRGSPTCAVYCHGATLNAGGTSTAPSWTGAPVTCGDCHGVPPPAPHPSSAITNCVTCHPDTMNAAGGLIAPSAGGKHLDGILEASGHEASWMDTASPNFHAYSADRGLDGCQQCHGVALDGVGGSVSIGCNQCHGAAWKTTCTMCHGGTDNGTGAPPRPTWGSTSTVAVGAHTSHVAQNGVSAPYGCAECHVMPEDALSAGHVGGSAGVSFAGAVSGLKGGTWNFPVNGTPTCSSTYCHGNFTRGTATNAPSWTGTNQAGCGSCHLARPVASLHRKHLQQQYFANALWPWWPLPGATSGWVTCDQCHFGIAENVAAQAATLTQVNGGGPPLHVDGKPDVIFKLGGTYTLDAFQQGNCSSMACHTGEGTKEWPR